MTTKNILARTE